MNCTIPANMSFHKSYVFVVANHKLSCRRTINILRAYLLFVYIESRPRAFPSCKHALAFTRIHDAAHMMIREGN
jgi:hypothetical protein